MQWGECRLIALQTMFSNEGIGINADDVNQDYLNAMPGKANEAMLQIVTVGRPLLKSCRIRIEKDAEAAEGPEELVLPVQKKAYRIELRDCCPRFLGIEWDQVMLETDRGYGRTRDWDLEGESILLLPGNKAGVYTVWYDAYPVKITHETPDETELELPEEAAALVPLYIAAELYKEDELAMATMFRNEFEDGLGKLQAGYAARSRGGAVSKVKNTTKWW